MYRNLKFALLLVPAFTTALVANGEQPHDDAEDGRIATAFNGLVMTSLVTPLEGSMLSGGPYRASFGIVEAEEVEGELGDDQGLLLLLREFKRTLRLQNDLHCGGAVDVDDLILWLQD
jgi:hypothetical protein